MKYYQCYQREYQKFLENERSPYMINSSLLEFFHDDVKNRLTYGEDGICRIMEVGCGMGSIFQSMTEIPPVQVTAIDVAQNAISIAEKFNSDKKINYKMEDICLANYHQEFNLVLDTHCYHCLIDNSDRRKALKNIYQSLLPGGLFVMETMTSHKRMAFEGDFKFSAEDDTLFQQNTYAGYSDLKFIDGIPYLPVRKIRHAMEIEKEIFDSGLKIIFLYVYSNRKVIPEEGRTTPLESDPDLLRLIAIKE